MITNFHCCLLSFFLPFSGSNVLSFVNFILWNFDCIKVCRSGLWSYCHYAGSPPTNSPPQSYQTPSTFIIQEQTTLIGELTGGERITTRHSLVHTKDNFETIKKCTKLKFGLPPTNRPFPSSSQPPFQSEAK